MTRDELSLTPFGVPCVIRRRDAARRQADVKPLPGWEVRIERAVAFALSWDGRPDTPPYGPQQHYLATLAVFEFDPDVAGAEDEALEYARRYCVDVAGVIAQLRPALEGLVTQAEAMITEAARRHFGDRVKVHGDTQAATTEVRSGG